MCATRKSAGPNAPARALPPAHEEKRKAPRSDKETRRDGHHKKIDEKAGSEKNRRLAEQRETPGGQPGDPSTIKRSGTFQHRCATTQSVEAGLTAAGPQTMSQCARPEWLVAPTDEVAPAPRPRCAEKREVVDHITRRRAESARRRKLIRFVAVSLQRLHNFPQKKAPPMHRSTEEGLSLRTQRDERS